MKMIYIYCLNFYHPIWILYLFIFVVSPVLRALCRNFWFHFDRIGRPYFFVTAGRGWLKFCAPFWTQIWQKLFLNAKLTSTNLIMINKSYTDWVSSRLMIDIYLYVCLPATWDDEKSGWLAKANFSTELLGGLGFQLVQRHVDIMFAGVSRAD